MLKSIPMSATETIDPVAVPKHRAFEDTGEVLQVLNAETDPMESLAKLIMDAAEQTPEKVTKKNQKSIKRHNWITLLMALTLGPGGAVAVVWATSDRSKANAQSVEQLKGLQPRVDQNDKALRQITQDVADNKTAIAAMGAQQGKILSGIDELKKENVNQLKQGLAETKQELAEAKRRLRKTEQ